VQCSVGVFFIIRTLVLAILYQIGIELLLDGRLLVLEQMRVTRQIWCFFLEIQLNYIVALAKVSFLPNPGPDS
jgi:hypothetical protein